MIPRLRWVSLLRLFMAILLASAVGIGLSRIRFDANILDLLPPDLPEVRALGLFLRHFGQPRELILTIEAGDAASAGAMAASLADALRSAGDNCLVWDSPPWIARPEALSQLAAYLLINQSDSGFNETLRKLRPAAATERANASFESIGSTFSPEEVARFGYDPLDLLSGLPESGMPGQVSREFSSSDGRFRVLYVTPSLGEWNDRAPPSWVGLVIMRIREWQAQDQDRQKVRVGWTGEPAFVYEISSAMTRDIFVSSISSCLFASLLFYLAHRRFRILGRAMVYIGLSFLIALGLTGLIFPKLTIISVGFAAILAGLTVDYIFLITRRWSSRPGSLSSLRAGVYPGILAASATTAAAFFSLNFSGLPGLTQLGTIVAVGVLVAAYMTIHYYTRDLMRITPPISISRHKFQPTASRLLILAGTTLSVSILPLAFVVLVLCGWPRWTEDTQALRPKNSVAYPTLDRLSAALSEGSPDTLSVLVEGKSVEEVRAKLSLARARLNQGVSDRIISSFDLPDHFWPKSDFQTLNLAAAGPLIESAEELRKIIFQAGFSESAAFLTTDILRQWEGWGSATNAIWPDGEAFLWIARRTMSYRTREFAACGLVVEMPTVMDSRVDEFTTDLAQDGIYLVAWRKLGVALTRYSQDHGLWAVLAFFTALAAALAISLRRVSDVVLALGMALLSLLVLSGLMRLFSLEWNFINVFSLSLTIGMGVDYSLHMIFSLREHHGNVHAVYRDVGTALALCTATTVGGFTSLAWSQTDGLASLGINCAIGIAVAATSAIFLLPLLWIHMQSALSVQKLRSSANN